MTTVRTRPNRGRIRTGSRAASVERLPVCAFCRQDSSRVKFVIDDPDNLYNVCESCIDECARVIACSCVC